MTDARACRHPVQGAWQYGLLHPQAVTMCHLAFKQIGYGRQAYMGMWPDIQALGHRSSQCVRPHAVKENEGAHHAALAKWQQPAYFKSAAQVVFPGLNDKIVHTASR